MGLLGKMVCPLETPNFDVGNRFGFGDRVDSESDLVKLDGLRFGVS